VAVINCVAAADVGRCEAEPDWARVLNADFPGAAARAAAELGARLAHVSTHYVFGQGHGPDPISEAAPRPPPTAYRASKAEGEDAVMRADPSAAVLRVAALFGGGRPNFVDRILARARAGETLRVVDDQIVSPTFAADAARALVLLARTPEASGAHHA